MSGYTRGHVLWAVDAFGRAKRPWVILSNEKHPYHGDEYIAVPVTTSEHPRAIALSDDVWDTGGTPRDSWTKPWNVTLIEHADILAFQGRLTETATDGIRKAVIHYLT